MSGHIRHLAISHSHVFLVNSRLGHFSAPRSREVPLSRSYGVNLPSSLAVIHSSTLGSSPHPPVSVYGTGRTSLRVRTVFLRVWLPALSPRPKTRRTLGFQSPYVLQPPIPSGGGSVTPRSRAHLMRGLRNIDRIAIRCPSRVPVRSRLTLMRLALFRKPWVVGARVSDARCRYSCLHFLFRTLQQRSRVTFGADRNAPLPLYMT